MLQLWRHFLRTYETQPADRNGCIERHKRSRYVFNIRIRFKRHTYHHCVADCLPVFSNRVLGVLGLLMISTRCGSTIPTYGCISAPGEPQRREGGGEHPAVWIQHGDVSKCVKGRNPLPVRHETESHLLQLNKKEHMKNLNTEILKILNTDLTTLVISY